MPAAPGREGHCPTQQSTKARRSATTEAEEEEEEEGRVAAAADCPCRLFPAPAPCSAEGNTGADTPPGSEAASSTALTSSLQTEEEPAPAPADTPPAADGPAAVMAQCSQNRAAEPAAEGDACKRLPAPVPTEEGGIAGPTLHTMARASEATMAGASGVTLLSSLA